MEYAPNGELFDYLMKKKLLSEEEACKFFQQIIAGLEYCHKLHIWYIVSLFLLPLLTTSSHRDLKPENVLLDKNFKVKVADFGMASIVRPGELQATSCGYVVTILNAVCDENVCVFLLSLLLQIAAFCRT